MTVLTGQLMQNNEEVRYVAMLKAFEDSDFSLVCMKNDCSFPRPGISQVSHVLKQYFEEMKYFLCLLNLIVFVTVLLNKLVSK